MMAKAGPRASPGASLREQARDFIRGAIVSGRMKLGELYSAPRLAAEGDLIAYLQADRRFHIALIGIVENKALSGLDATGRALISLTPDQSPNLLL